jgi:hypothetical protein
LAAILLSAPNVGCIIIRHNNKSNNELINNQSETEAQKVPAFLNV